MNNFEEAIASHKINLLKKAFAFFSKKLEIEHYQNLSANVDTTGQYVESMASGVCIGSFIGKNYDLKGVQIYIRNSGSPIGMIDVLAHEMIHAWQHINGHFKWLDKKDYRFKKFGLKLFPYTKKSYSYKGAFHDEVKYFDRACEQEAFTYGSILLRLFLEEHRADVLLITEDNVVPLNAELEKAILLPL